MLVVNKSSACLLNSDTFLLITRLRNVEKMNDPFSFIAPSLSSRPSHNSTTSSSQTKKNSSVDAFHDLVSFNVNSTASTQSSNNLTLAERVAKAEQERKTRLNNDTYATQSSFWDKFDTSSAHTPLKPDARPASSSNVVAPSSLADGKSRAVSPAEDSWDFISFDTSKPSRDLSSTSTLHSKQTSPFDSDDGSLLVDLTDTLQPLAVPHPDSPGSFDFGERDERYENHEEDDILGDFVQNTVFRMFLLNLVRSFLLACLPRKIYRKLYLQNPLRLLHQRLLHQGLHHLPDMY